MCLKNRSRMTINTWVVLSWWKKSFDISFQVAPLTRYWLICERANPVLWMKKVGGADRARPREPLRSVEHAQWAARARSSTHFRLLCTNLLISRERYIAEQYRWGFFFSECRNLFNVIDCRHHFSDTLYIINVWECTPLLLVRKVGDPCTRRSRFENSQSNQPRSTQLNSCPPHMYYYICVYPLKARHS